MERTAPLTILPNDLCFTADESLKRRVTKLTLNSYPLKRRHALNKR
jgi:hypothetical protein